MEETNTGTCRADHFGQRFLLKGNRYDRWITFLPIVRQKQEEACQPLLTRIEKLVDYVFLDAAVPAQ